MDQDRAADPTVVRVSSPADILGVLPHRLGFHPAESLVVVCLEGPRRRDRLVMRADLPTPRHDTEAAADLAARARDAGATAAIVVCYTDAPRDADESRLARSQLVDALVERLRGHRVEVVEALLVRRGRWWSYHCTDLSCCPGSGSPVPAELTPAASHYAAESVVLGGQVLEGRDALVRSIEPPEHAVARAVRAQALTRAAERLAATTCHDGPDVARSGTLATFRRLAAAWEEAGSAPDAEDAALVAMALHHTRTRDEVMTLVLDHEPGVLVGLMTELARRVDDTAAAPACTVLAWAAYADGRGALAAVAAERALRARPGYAMAQLVLDGLSRMLPPSEIRRICELTRDDLRDAG